MVALFRFGHYGNAASQGEIARKFGISEGAVEIYTCKVMAAITELSAIAMKWPSVGERFKLKTRIFKEFGFPPCVGYVDGTLVVLDTQPPLNGEDYFSRKKLYGLFAMVVCDDHRKSWINSR